MNFTKLSESPLPIRWHQPSVVSHKFIQKVQSMGATELVLKSPSVPLFQRGNFLRRNLTPLWKRGEGEIFGGSEAGIIWRTSGLGH